ncbi:MAG TPA: sulfotransferase [Thermoleophilaceae bacterium]|nr:sulfotransferase [Thermoleophilaceae bacterium]
MALRVVGAGLGRTGTASLKLALERLLGAPCYHAYELTNQHLDQVPMWHEAVRGKEPDWDHIYRGYAATVDWPGASFWRPLSRAYPDALVLLSTRDTDEWFRSADATIIEFTRRNGEQEVAAWEPEMQAWYSMVLELFETRFTPAPFEERAAKQAYERHNSEVRAEVPADRLLEWQPGDGWAPLCERLGVPVPDEPFPHINLTDTWRAGMGLPPRNPWRHRMGRLRHSLRRPVGRLLRR